MTERKVLASFSTREIAKNVVRRCGPHASPSEIDAAAYRAGRETVEDIVRRHGRKPRGRPVVAVFYGLLWLVVFLALVVAGCPQ